LSRDDRGGSGPRQAGVEADAPPEDADSRPVPALFSGEGACAKTLPGDLLAFA
jgi:hypothetical protein